MTEVALLAPNLPAVLIDAPHAREATGGWLFYLQAKSPNTVRAYLRDLDDWLGFCRANGFEPLNARRRHVDAWIAEQLREAEGKKPAAKSSVNRRLSSVSSWYAYLLGEEACDRNPVAAVKRPAYPSQDESTTIGLDRDQARALVRAAREDTHTQANQLRNVAMVTLLVHNALRCGEVTGLQDNDVGTVRGHRVLRIAGKGGRINSVPLAPATKDALDAYLAVRGPEPGPLFRTATGKPLDHKAVFRLVRRLARLAGLAEVMNRISPHSLRHTAITAALDAGVSLRDVQDYARHADPRTTRRYDRNRNSLDRHATYKVAAYLSED